MQAPLLTNEQVREIEERAIKIGLSGLLMMENAGRSIAEMIASQHQNGTVSILCGKGNNGGDGLVIARHLSTRGIRSRVLLFASPDALTDDAEVNLNILRHCDVEIIIHEEQELNRSALSQQIADSEHLVDALFGSGLKGPLRPPFDQLAEWVNEQQHQVTAVDVPSGLDVETGEPMGPTIQATRTVCLIAVRPGLLNASEWTGTIHCFDAGVPRSLFPEDMQTTPLP